MSVIPTPPPRLQVAGLDCDDTDENLARSDLRVPVMSDGMQVCICGGGHAAHAMCADISLKGYKVNMYMPFSDEAARFRAGVEKGNGLHITYVAQGRTEVATPHAVSNTASDVVPGSKYIFIPLPVFAHYPTLMDIVPHTDSDAVIIPLPATGAFDWTAEKVFKKLGKRVHIAGIAPLPYVCRFSDFGASVDLFSKKELVGMATSPPQLIHSIAGELQEMLGFAIEEYPSFLALTLTPTNPIMHTARMYGMLVASKEGYWRDRTRCFGCNPKFYDDCDEASNEWLHRLDNENQQIVAELERVLPGCIGGKVRKINDFLKWAYGEQIENSDTAGDCFRTNKAFHGLGSPMLEVATGFWVPDFKSRYFTEDFPFGLLANRGLAELLGVPTPDMDTVIEWAQMEMGKRWLVDGKVNPTELPQVTPQALGITKDDLKSLYSQENAEAAEARSRQP